MFKIYTKLHEQGDWIAVIDVKASKTQTVPRIFMSQKEVDSFIGMALSNIDEKNIKVEQLSDG